MLKKTIPVFIIFIVIAINLFFGLPRIEKFTAGDETFWSYDRVPKFWKSLKKGNWRGTSLCDKPGITLAAISGLGLPFIPDPQDYEEGKSDPKDAETLKIYKNIYFYLRLPVYLFFILSLFVFFYFIKKLWGEQTAIFSVIFIGLSPILLGISLIVNADALLWILMPLVILSFLIYQKDGDKKFLWLSGIIMGLSILDKYVANLLFPFVMALVFLKYIFSDFQEKEDKRKYFKKAILDYLVFFLISIATVVILYPAVWVKAKELLNVTIFSLAMKNNWKIIFGALTAVIADTFLLRSILSIKAADFLKKFRIILISFFCLSALLFIAYAFLNVFQDMKHLDFENLFFMPKPDYSFLVEFKANLLSSFYPLIFGLSPIVSALFISSIIIILISPKLQNEKQPRWINSFALLSFILVYYLANSMAQISSTVRYQIVIYPVASILAAIGLSELIRLKKIPDFLTGCKFYALLAILIFASFLSLNSIRPHFLSYASNWLPNKYILNPRDMGDGSWEASEYLNSLPEAEKLLVWTDKKQVCEKFAGRCETIFDKDLDYDYFIASTGGQTETLHKSIVKGTQKYKIGSHYVDPEKLYDKDDYFDYKVIIGGRPRNFVKVISAGKAAE